MLTMTVSGELYAQDSKRKKRKKRTDTQQKTPAESLRKVANLSSDDEKRVEKFFFDGMKAKIKDDTKTAILAFKDCIKIDQYNGAAMYELAKIYFDLKDKEAALNYAASASDTDPTNKWYQFLYAEVLSLNGDYEAAAEVYATLVKQNPNNYEHYLDWGYMLIYAEKYEEAVAVYNQLEEKIGVTENVSLQKQRLYSQLDKPEEAIKELEKLIENDPQNTKLYPNLATLYEESGKPKKAAALYEKMVEADANNPYGRLALSEFYRQNGDGTKAFEILEEACKDETLPLEIKVRSITPYLQELQDGSTDDNTKKGLYKVVEIITKAHPKDALAQALYGDLLLSDKRQKEALTQFQKAAKVDGSKFEVWKQIMYIQYELRDFDGLISTSEEVMTIFPNRALSYYLNGLSKKQKGEYEAAVKILKKAKMMSGGDKSMLFQIYSILGESYNELKKYTDSDKSYEKAIKIEPNDPTILNNYSYYLSLRNEKLERAAEMSKKTNELVPDNASFEDTYGWILFQQKKYKEAKEWLGKALQNGGDQNATILEHYGDALFKLNDTPKAVEYWQKAAAMSNGKSAIALSKKIQSRMMAK